jgi:hypothetical protein
MALKVVIVNEVVEPEVIESVYGSFANYMQVKLKEFVENPESPKLIGKVTASVESTGSLEDPDFIRFRLQGFAEDSKDSQRTRRIRRGLEGLGKGWGARP